MDEERWRRMRREIGEMEEDEREEERWRRMRRDGG